VSSALGPSDLGSTLGSRSLPALLSNAGNFFRKFAKMLAETRFMNAYSRIYVTEIPQFHNGARVRAGISPHGACIVILEHSARFLGVGSRPTLDPA